MSNFDQTPEVILSNNMRGACDRVLNHCFSPKQIKRFTRDDELFVLDKHFHIDLVLTLPNGSQLTGQEKTLSNKFYSFRTFTMEFYQNRYTKEPGEFFHIASQFYLHGYAHKNQKNFVEWMIVDLLLLLDWLKSKPIEDLEKQTRSSEGSRASFFYIPYDTIPKEFILHHWKYKPQPLLFS
jgi:hypothetical protein